MKKSACYLSIVLLGFAVVSCKKEAIVPDQNSFVNTTVKTTSPLLQLSANLVSLTQENETKVALSLTWNGFQSDGGTSPDYRIEACNAGSRFTGWYQIGATCKPNYDYTVKELNQQIRQLFVSGFAEDVLIRIKKIKSNETAEYSYAADLQVTTYQPVITYADANTIRIPGNFQKWDVGEAPTIVSSNNDGEYEGYIDFRNDYPQFLMVKSARVWDNLSTYYYIGANKFGFGGSIFCLSQGTGVYRLRANKNTNTWSCTKIDGWNISGSVVTNQADQNIKMNYNYVNKVWEITGAFAKGSFIFKSLEETPTKIGHNANSPIGLAEYNGSPIEIIADGNYTIRLSLMSAGNYSYSILRN